MTADGRPTVIGRLSIVDCSVGAQHLCHAPVHDQHFAERTNHDVFGLQIAVDDASRVCEGDGFTHLLKDAQHVVKRSCAFRGLIEPRALYELHRVENATVIKRAYVVYGNDAWMLEQRDDTSFAHHSRGERT